MGRRLAATVVLCLASTAQAEDLIYVEALGKGGAYGVGYEHELMPGLGVGAAASFMLIEGQQVYTFAPYLHLSLLGERRHKLFSELGAVLAHSRIPSPVEDWDGMTDTGSGGFFSLGHEYTRGH